MPGPLAIAPDDLVLDPGRPASGVGPSATARCSNAGASSSPPTTIRSTCRTPGSTRRSRPTTTWSTRCSRYTCAPPTPRYTRERRAEAHRDPRPRRRRRDRAGVVSTPWSRSMFAAELQKPGSLSLGAYGESASLVGYLIVSRYVDAWHVMNVAVAPEYRRRGIAPELIERLFEVTGGDPRRGYTLEVRVSNAGRHPAVRAARLRGPRDPPRLLHRQPRGRADHVARAVGRGRAGGCIVILALETSCDETAAAVVSDEGEIRSSVVSSQAELHAPLRRGGPRDRLAAPPGARRSGRARGASAMRRSRSTTSTGSRSPRARARRRPAGRHLDGEGDRVARGTPLVPVDHLDGHVAALYLGDDPLEPPFVCLLASGGHTLLLLVRRARPLGAARLDLDDAAGEAFDKGRGSSASATRAASHSTVSLERATPRRSRSPSRAFPDSTSRSRA